MTNNANKVHTVHFVETPTYVNIRSQPHSSCSWKMSQIGQHYLTISKALQDTVMWNHRVMNNIEGTTML